MDFPDFEYWKLRVLAPEDTTWVNFHTPEWHRYYQDKCRICELIQPKTILEIGVRFGYSAHAFLCCSSVTHYAGIDVNDPKYGGWVRPTMGDARRMLEQEHPDKTITLYEGNTQAGFRPDWSDYDFIHVDADHSYRGCVRDLQTFWPMANKALLVDDYEDNTEVHWAVNDFVSESGFGGFLLTGKSKRGEALLIK